MVILNSNLVNLASKSIFYPKQGYQSVKDNKKIYYVGIFLIEQVNEYLNPPEYLHSHECGDREVKTCRTKYDEMTGTFQGLYETLGYIMVRVDPQEHFLGYGYSKQNSKIFHSHYKKRIPSSFSGTFFNRHRIQFESGAFHGSNISNIYYFCLVLPIGSRK